MLELQDMETQWLREDEQGSQGTKSAPPLEALYPISTGGESN